MNLNSHFAADIPEAFTHAFGVGDQHIDVYLAVLVHMCSSVCIVVLQAEVIVNFGLQSMENPLGVVISAEGCIYV